MLQYSNSPHAFPIRAQATDLTTTTTKLISNRISKLLLDIPVGFSRSCLSVSKETSIVAFKRPVQKWLGQPGVDMALVGKIRTLFLNRPETVVVEEAMDDSVLGCDDCLVAMHTNDLLRFETMLPTSSHQEHNNHNIVLLLKLMVVVRW